MPRAGRHYFLIAPLSCSPDDYLQSTHMAWRGQGEANWFAALACWSRLDEYCSFLSLWLE
jgi:hypothetical protein